MANLRKDTRDVVRHSSFAVADLRNGTLTALMVWIPLVFCGALGQGDAAAQEPVNYKAADTSSPRDTLRSFIDACNEIHDLINSAKYFDRNDPRVRRHLLLPFVKK